MLSNNKIKKQIQEFISIANCIKFYKPESLLKPYDVIDPYKLDLSNPLLRGQLLEEALIKKIILINRTRVLNRLEGYLYMKRFKLKIKIPNYLFWNKIGTSDFLLHYLIENSPFKIPQSNQPNCFDYKELNFGGEKLFKAKKRCITKPSIEYCFIDVIIDDTIIDIKTDTSTNDIKQYFKQIFIQSVLYSCFLKLNIDFDAEISLKDRNLIKQPIKNIALYYWRTNEFFKFCLSDIIPNDKFEILVNIYSELQVTHSTQLRHHLKQIII